MRLCVALLSLSLCLGLMGHVRAQEEADDMEMNVEDAIDDMQEEDVEEEEQQAPTSPPVPTVTYKAPEPMGEHYFAESFDKETLHGWVLSQAKKDGIDEEIAKYDGKWEVEEMKDTKLPGDKGLVLKSKAKHHAISALLLRPFTFDTKPLIVQYEVNFQTGIDCGGAYVKLLSQTPDLDLEEFVDKTPYTIMYGPDKCGEDYKLHFIFRHKNPKTGEFEEKHAKKPDADLRSYYTDKKTHLYTLVLNPDNSFEILIDQAVVNSGSLLNDMTPPINPPAEIEDPDDHKPEDWDERPKIQDPDAGVWKPRKIPNPDFFEDLHPFRMTPISAVGLELWSMSSDIFFDNFFITSDRNVAERWAADGWGLKKAAEGAAEPSLVNQMITAAEERPWLWIVYVLTVALPLVLIIVFCCTGKKSSASTSAAEYKKTDAPQPDVKEEAEEEEEEEEAKEDFEEAKEEESGLKDKQLLLNLSYSQMRPKSEDDILRRSPRNRKPRKD
uniref:Calnexin n=1 Tax=Sinocyclocheilus grahami TaxID=75366 RepID=A0A672TDN7_SINGR